MTIYYVTEYGEYDGNHDVAEMTVCDSEYFSAYVKHCQYLIDTLPVTTDEEKDNYELFCGNFSDIMATEPAHRYDGNHIGVLFQILMSEHDYEMPDAIDEDGLLPLEVKFIKRQKKTTPSVGGQLIVEKGLCQIEEKTFNIRVRQESVGYFTVKAVNLREAEKMASTLMGDEAPCPIEEFEEFNPADYGDDYTHSHIERNTPRIVEKGFCQIEDGQIYPCFYTPKRDYWNGWAMPLLEESVYKNWLESIDDGGEEVKEMIAKHKPVEVYDVLTGEFLKCYANDYGYCWDEVSQDDD